MNASVMNSGGRNYYSFADGRQMNMLLGTSYVSGSENLDIDDWWIAVLTQTPPTPVDVCAPEGVKYETPPIQYYGSLCVAVGGVGALWNYVFEDCSYMCVDYLIDSHGVKHIGGASIKTFRKQELLKVFGFVPFRFWLESGTFTNTNKYPPGMLV